MLGEKVKIKGQIITYIYEKSDSTYRIARIKTDSNKKLTIVGNFPHLDEGLSYEFVGEIKKHINYGEELFLETYSRLETFSVSGLIDYLSSDKFYGIGKALATKIVDTLGTNCLNDIINNPDVLNKVEGLSDEKKKNLVRMIKENFESERTYVRLYEFGLTLKMIERLIDHYGLDAANKIEEDPYRLIYDIEGFGFKKADTIAFNIGIKEDDPKRIKAAICYALNNVCFKEGFTYLTKEQLVNSVKAMLNNEIITDDLLIKSLDELVDERKIIFDEDRYFDSYLYHAEKNVASKIKKMANVRIKYNKEEIIEALNYVEGLIDIKYTPMQREAIINSLANNLSIISGGPGTGKSTIIKGILSCYAKLNKMSLSDDIANDKILLAAPTGRAAKRMTEITKFKASTIHKALGYNINSEFTKGKDNELTYSIIIIDESSMIDIPLASTLFDAMPTNTILIFVGDINQLPSVGPGNFLNDIIDSPFFKVTYLTQIMRQASDSNIISLSTMIQSEEIDFRLFTLKKEVFFYTTDSKSLIVTLFKLLDNFISSGGDLFSGIEILIPMYAGAAGIDEVNKEIQKRYNSEEEKVLIRDNKIFKKGDKVLQLKNDGKLDIMNGDIGKIADIAELNGNEALIVNFDDRMINYPLKDLDNLTLAYAISIHKSQGSEFDNVILPILPSYTRMLKKKLIYTAVTRAKNKLIIVGDGLSFSEGIKKGDYGRQTALYTFLVNKEDDRSIKIYDKDIPFDTLGEYGMEGITPYTFMDN